MARKSSQPRRSASRKSERPILRTTYAVGMPNHCSLGLAKYCVAMTPVSLLVVAGGEGRSSSRAHPSHARRSRLSPANQVQRRGALPDDTCRDRNNELSAMEARSKKQDRAYSWVICASAHVVLHMSFVALQSHHQTMVPTDAR